MLKSNHVTINTDLNERLWQYNQPSNYPDLETEPNTPKMRIENFNSKQAEIKVVLSDPFNKSSQIMKPKPFYYKMDTLIP